MNTRVDYDEADFKVANMMLPQMKLSLAINQRKVVINDDINETTAMEFIYLINKILDYDNKMGTKPPIEIQVNTNGGSAIDCFLMVDLIEQLKDDGYKIITVNIGKAYSAGLAIALSGSERHCYKRARYMLHDVSSGTFGKLRSMEEQIEETKVIRESYFDIIKKYSNLPDSFYKRCTDNQADIFISAEDMSEFKGVDKIL